MVVRITTNGSMKTIFFKDVLRILLMDLDCQVVLAELILAKKNRGYYEINERIFSSPDQSAQYENFAIRSYLTVHFQAYWA